MVYIQKTTIIRSQDGLQKDTSVAFVFHPLKLLFLCPEVKKIQFFMTVFRRRLGFEPMTNNTFEICLISLISALQQQRLGCVTLLPFADTGGPFQIPRTQTLEYIQEDVLIHLGPTHLCPQVLVSLSHYMHFLLHYILTKLASISTIFIIKTSAVLNFCLVNLLYDCIV